MIRDRKVIFNFIMVIVTIFSIFFDNYKYLPFIFCGISFIMNLILNRYNVRVFISIGFILLCTIVANILIIRNNYDDSTDLFEGVNILLGKFQYNDGVYEFFDDKTFVNNYNNGDYCMGEYYYSYGGVTVDNEVIKQDNSYYYYSLNLYISYCFYNEEKEDIDKSYDYIFGVNKSDLGDIYFIDNYDNYIFKLKKVK